MATFLVATGSALALMARFTEWRADRKHSSLMPTVDIEPFPSDGIATANERTELEVREVRNGPDVCKLVGRRRFPEQL